ncbi:MAG: enoyl-CoA hydratase/isomerase family protein [Hyphomicrobiales bacterium]|nr:enoyl-CoA hydratase/isomerase family protein [Hyphomicrobiales bacterium]
MPGTITLDIDDTLATVTLCNAARMNALDLVMWRQLEQAFTSLAGNAHIRCVVLRGEGRQAFAAGADIAEFHRERASSAQATRYAEVTHATLQALAQCPHPVVARIQGACVGGGLEIASTCDLRIAAQSSRFGIPVKRLGLVVSYDELRRLIALCGRATVLEILFEGRVFDAAEALDKGLLNRVVPDAALDAEISTVVRRISEGAPLAARWHKHFVNRLAEPAPITDDEAAQCYACFDTRDFHIGMQSFIDKTKPTFLGR